ncbi:hypothetical protein, partial [Rhizobium sp. L58/93]|uniref:hypothetical protein n=1 Tax=Rhizobium sp. L58/93 TaxID=2820000 RepID=UPI001ADA4411
RQPGFDRIRCPRLSETLVRDLLKPLSRFSEIRTGALAGFTWWHLLPNFAFFGVRDCLYQ